MDHDARVRLEVALGLAAALGPVLAALLGFRLGPFRRLRAGDVAARRLRGRWVVAVLAVPAPVLFAVALVVDVMQTNASKVYVLDPYAMPSVWALTVTGPWVVAGFIAGGRHLRAGHGAASAPTGRVRRQLALASAMAAWSVYGPFTFVAALGRGLSMSDSDSGVIAASIHRADLAAGVGCALTSMLVVTTARRGGRPTATTAAIAAMPAAYLAVITVSALLG